MIGGVALAAREVFERAVKQGDRRARIEANVEQMRGAYEQTVTGLAPDAPSFAEARALVLDTLSTLLP